MKQLENISIEQIKYNPDDIAFCPIKIHKLIAFVNEQQKEIEKLKEHVHEYEVPEENGVYYMTHTKDKTSQPVIKEEERK